MQNNESYNALVLGRLYKKYVMTKYLQPYGFLFAPEMNRSCEISTVLFQCFLNKFVCLFISVDKSVVSVKPPQQSRCYFPIVCYIAIYSLQYRCTMF